MSGIQAPGVILDVDDTLYLERDYVRSGFNAVGRFLSQLGVIDAGAELWAGFEAGVRGTAFNDLLRSRGLVAKVSVDQLVTVYREHEPSIELLPDAKRALEMLGDRFIGIITDGPSASQHAKINALGIRGLIDHVVVTSDFGPGFGKPHVRAFREMEDVSGLCGQNLVYVADNPVKDFLAPRELGWKTLRIRRPGGLHAGCEWDGETVSEFPKIHEHQANYEL
ncbi:MAG: HAD family hydrolase [Acidimicrobiia bacterium]|nr:HAD family hydrolase [Acidimicrobiia bacterium]